jgi:capsular exopolysaccharide synthesis family protein
MAELDQAVRTTAIPGLMVLPSGRIPPNPAELLGSKRFAQFLGILECHFDWVIIDTPPVMTVADASIVAHTAKGVMFVVNADSTSRRAAQAALDRLDGVDARFIGAVLNGVKVDQNAFSYSAYYGRGDDKYHLPA